MNWTCGNPTCDRPLAWHARRADYLRTTAGPDAEREFEDEHPEPGEEPELSGAYVPLGDGRNSE